MGFDLKTFWFLAFNFLSSIGIIFVNKIIFKTDGEAACKSLQNKVQRLRAKETLLENSPKGDSKANGAAEKAVQEVMEQVRAIKLG